MDRREFLLGSIAFGSLFVLDGCGGGGSESSSVSERRTATIIFNHEKTKAVSVPVGSSVLDAIQIAFSYERQAPLKNPAALTTIDGVADHWRYTVDGDEPLVHANKYPIIADCSIELEPLKAI